MRRGGLRRGLRSGFGCRLRRQRAIGSLSRGGDFRRRARLDQDLAVDVERLELFERCGCRSMTLLLGAGRGLRRLARFAITPVGILAELSLQTVEPLLLEAARFLLGQDLLHALLLADIEIRAELQDVDDARGRGERSAEDEADLRHRPLDLVVARVEDDRPVAVERHLVEVDRGAADGLGVVGVDRQALQPHGPGSDGEGAASASPKGSVPAST